MTDLDILTTAADTVAARLDAATHAQLMEMAGHASIGEPEAGHIVRDRLDGDTE